MVIKTFNLEEDVYKKFSNFCKENGFSMSKQVNIFIKAQIETEQKVRDGYLQKLDAIRRGRFIKVGSIENFKNKYA
jgi:hypothetical protein